MGLILRLLHQISRIQEEKFWNFAQDGPELKKIILPLSGDTCQLKIWLNLILFIYIYLTVLRCSNRNLAVS